MMRNFDEVCRLFFKNRTSRSMLIQQTLMTLLPRIAAHNQDLFALNHLSDGVSYLQGCLRKEREKAAAFRSMGLMVYVLKDRMDLEPVLQTVKTSLPTGKEVPTKRASRSGPAYEPSVFLCISMLARAVGEKIESEMSGMLDQMFSAGLTVELTSALQVLSERIPTLQREIQDGLLKMLYMVLLHQQLRHPGAPKTQAAALQPTPLPGNVMEADIPSVTLALQTLGSFNFGASPPLQLVQICAEHYLTSEHRSVRMEAVKTCAALLVPSLLPPSIFTTPFVQFSQASAQVVGDVLSKMLVVGITDPDDEIRECVFLSLDKRFDPHLAQAESLTTLFMAMQDGVFRIRELAMCIIGRLSSLNPAFVMPTLRKVLIQILTELEYSGVGRNKEQSAKLLGHLVANAPKLVRPYHAPILKVLIPKLKEPDLNPNVVINIVATIGELVQVAREDMRGCVQDLCPILMTMLQDSSSLARREVALWTFGQLVENTGYVIEPYHEFPNLLDILFSFLKTEQPSGVKREVVRVLGLLGALDPYKHKQQQRNCQPSKMGTPLSKPMDKTTPGQSTAVGDSASALLVSMGSGASLEDFYPSIAINSLMRILRDQSLSQHHTMAIQALGFIFKSLSIKSVPYLPQVMPPFLHAIRSCSRDMREYMFKQLAQIVSIIKQHARDYMQEIFSVIREFWTTEHQHLQNTIILLIEKIVAGMGDELKIYIPRMVEPVLKLFLQDQSKMKISTQKMLAALQLCGASLDDYLHLLVPPIVKVFETDTNPTDVRRTALETIEKLSQTVDFSDYASQIIHSIVVVLDTSSELRPVAMDALCSLMTQLGQRFRIFIPMVKKVMTKNRYNYTNYELLLVRLLRDEPLSPEDDVDRQLKAGKSKSSEDDSAEIEAASFKKFPLEPNALTRAWSSVGRVSKEDWVEWLRRLGVELLKESPSPSLRSCWALAQAYNTLARELFNAAFVSCWMELRPVHQEDLVTNLTQALTHQTIPEITQTILNLAEFMEHCEEATGRLPLSSELLGECAMSCRAYAKALHYKEEDFHRGPTSSNLEALISINNKLQQPDAAAGVLVFAKQQITGDFKVQEKWYESLHDWEAAYKAYTERQKQRPDDISLTLGKMRCLHAMGEWTRLYEIACESWGLGDDATRQKMSVMASAAAWGLGQWESMEEYVGSIPQNTMEGSFYQALLHIHQKEFHDAQKCIDMSRDILVTELTTLATESYSRAYGVMVSVQLLSELEETVLCLMQSDRKTQLQQTWWNRLLGCQRNTEDWQRILQVRSIVLSQQEEIQSWVKFASICRRSDKMALSERTLRSILSHDPAYSTDEPLSDKYPSVTFAFVKHLWQTGERDRAFDLLSKFVHTLQPLTPATQNTQDTRLLARCYQKLGDWRLQLEERGGSVPSRGPAISAILQHYHRATEYNRSSYKAWHAWAFMNLQALLEHKKPSSGKAAVYSSPGEIGHSSSHDQQTTPTSGSHDLHAPPTETKLITYACSAVHGFFRSISLSLQSSLQDTLRLLTLWFDYGHYPDVHDAVTDGLKTIDIDTWLQVIPQLIARIDHPRRLVAKLIHDLLTDVGKQHPQALIYPLTVASKSQSPMRRAAADTILQNMTEHSSRLVQQAILVSEELIRVAILWHEQWHEGLEDASRMYFGEHNVKAMLSILEPLHHRMERGPETLKEISFNHAYGRDLAEAYEWCKKYQSTGNVKELTQAWELYYHVFRKISKQLPQLTTLELQYVSPKLMGCVDLELAVPGTYEPNQPVVHIRRVSATLNVITSKQRPRKLVIQGSNGRDYMFLLKGHEDLRQDERVMQLFGLVNTLLGNDPETFKRHLSIERYSVIPLSPNSGLIGWVPHCDTIHSLIRDYREKKKIMLNIEHRLMLQMSSDYDHLTLMQKVEVFEQAIDSTSGDDLAKVLWLKSPSSEVWFDRRTNYTRSLAVMSMVGYILGLGDRHPSNLMLDRLTGRILHIDFGDCFEVAMTREKFPEKIPFRLTRMLTNAMEVTGIEGNFRRTCMSVMTVLRENKDSVMAVLEAFVYDPLLNWRLMDETAKAKSKNKETGRIPETSGTTPLSMDRQGSQSYHPEELNKRAVAITQRVRLKLTGNDFPHEKSLTVDRQVQLLIEQATSHQNLCQCYIGWCPFW
jgi:FKBP12-rapamycin complex-associated protein